MGRNVGGSVNPEGLVMYLDGGNADSLDPNSIANWTDLSGFNNDGTVGGSGTSYSTDGRGSVLTTDVNNWYDCGDDISLKISGSLTLESWVKTTDSASSGDFPGIITKRNHFGAGDSSYILIMRPDTGPRAAAITVDTSGSTSGVLSTKTINDGNWHHVVGTYIRDDYARIYIDGILDGTASTSGSGDILDKDNPVLVGNMAYNGSPSTIYSWDGNIAVAKIYNRALSAEEVAENYRTLKQRFK